MKGACASLVRAFDGAIAAIDLASLVRAELAHRREDVRDACVLAIGKAAPAMASGALDTCAGPVLVIAPEGTALPSALDAAGAFVMRAAHPLPDERSVAAAESALAFVGHAPRVLVLLSGGASSLVCAPHADGSLEAKREVTRALLASGASIEETNTVRRHLSRIKGGGLARAAAPARVTTLLVSDVLAGALHDIGSGPTVADPTTIDDARAVLAWHAPAFASMPLHETAKEVDADARVIASPDTFAEAVARTLASDFSVRVLEPSTASIDALAAEYAALARLLAPHEAVVRSAEPSLVVGSARGRGGRCSHLAARVALDLPADVAFLAGASDGRDGSSDTAGACVHSATFPDRARVLASLAAFDTAQLHDAHEASIRRAPTGLNFTDVHVLARIGA